MKNNTVNSDKLKNYYIYPGQIGKGSFGVVRKGRDTRVNSDVALKYIPKKGRRERELKDIRNENEILKKINHQFIIKLLEVIETQTDIIIITEYAETDLGKVLVEKKKFQYEDVKKISRQIFEALNYLHENNIIHRDLKPQNILIKDGMVKICDFGFAKKLSASTAFVYSIKGTPLYIAPQILKQEKYNYKVDIWSFGIIIYELFEGRTPFHSNTFQQLRPKILNLQVKYTAQFPKQLRQLINQMLQKVPTTRASWKYLKQHSFLQAPQLQELHTDVQIKNSISVFENIFEKIEKVDNESLEDRFNIASKVEFRIEGENSQEEIDKIDSDIQNGKANLKELKTNQLLTNKLLCIIGTACVTQQNNKGQQLPKESIYKVCRILFNLLTKVKLFSHDDIEHDITKDRKLLFCLIKLAEKETQGKILAMELMVIGFMLKNNFDNKSIDFSTQEDITEICINQIKNPHNAESFRNALTILGILACQAIITLDQSQQFIKKVQQEKYLQVVAESYSQQNAKLVLECLQKFIHPNFPGSTSGDHVLNQTFHSLKQQVAKSLLNTKFISQQSPLIIFTDKHTLQSYAKILYQCLSVSQNFIKQFQKHDYWTDFACQKNLKIYCLAFDYLMKFNLLTREIIDSQYIKQESESKIMKIFLIGKAYAKWCQKKNAKRRWQPAKTILIQLHDLMDVDEDVKIKASRQIQGFLSYGERIYDNIVGQTFYNIVKDFIVENQQFNFDLCQSVILKLLSFNQSQKLKISEKLAMKLLILVESIPKIKKNETVLKAFGVLLKDYFIKQRVAYNIYESEKEQKKFKVRFFMTIFILLKNFHSIDEKHEKQMELYTLTEQANLHSLLLQIQVSERTLTLILNFIIKTLKIKGQRKEDESGVLAFLGNKVMPKLKPFLKTQEVDLLFQIVQSISALIKNNQQYAKEIEKLNIISYIPYYLNHQNQELRQLTLTMVGNLSKHSAQFFDQYESQKVFHSLKQSLQTFNISKKILKGLIYAIGNISFYTDKYYPQIRPLLPFLKEALSGSEDIFMGNVFSTFSNLLRHSKVYLVALHQNRIIESVLDIIEQTSKKGQKLDYGVNLLKKLLNYEQVFELVPKARFKRVIEGKKKEFPSNQTIKKLQKMLI